MASSITTITAPTKTELRKKVQEWSREAKSNGLTDIRRGYDPARVVKTEDGYKIEVWAHA